MIAMRALQGFFGGVLIPMAFTLVFTKLPKPETRYRGLIP
jgi:DHA2 family multidrug resistance protein